MVLANGWNGIQGSQGWPKKPRKESRTFARFYCWVQRKDQKVITELKSRLIIVNTYFFSVLIEKANAPPQDVAKLDFYRFIKSPMGADLHEMIFLEGQPSQIQWDHLNDWWLLNKQQLDEKLGKVLIVYIL